MGVSDWLRKCVGGNRSTNKGVSAENSCVNKNIYCFIKKRNNHSLLNDAEMFVGDHFFASWGNNLAIPGEIDG